ncbi:MAG: hypothetical protein U5J62_04270 [Desulfurivibrio sp.]|nr:hypothetical protein [Desulfurivibrio sp.]
MRERQVYWSLLLVLQLILVGGFIAEIWARQWIDAVLTGAIIMLTLVPSVLKQRFHVYAPPEFVLVAIAFVVASLFLGEVHGYYERYWWWDVALHTSSGFLLGIIGFLLVYILNEMEATELHLNPGFISFFAFFFALGIGGLWEIFEFTVDLLLGTNMQKEMLGDASGLTDTMFDLMVDALGALVITVLGWGYLKAARKTSFLERWINSFISNNPRFFRRKWRRRPFQS